MRGAWLFRGHLFAFSDPLLRRRGALGEEGDTFEQVHGALKLRVVPAQHSLAVLVLEALNASRRVLELDITLLLLSQRNDNIRSDAFLVNNL